MVPQKRDRCIRSSVRPSWWCWWWSVGQTHGLLVVVVLVVVVAVVVSSQLSLASVHLLLAAFQVHLQSPPQPGSVAVVLVVVLLLTARTGSLTGRHIPSRPSHWLPEN
jgi:hypothetical protein